MKFLTKKQVLVIYDLNAVSAKRYGLWDALTDVSPIGNVCLYSEDEVLEKMHIAEEIKVKIKESVSKRTERFLKARKEQIERNKQEKGSRKKHKSSSNVTNEDLKERLRLLKEIRELEESLNKKKPITKDNL